MSLLDLPAPRQPLAARARPTCDLYAPRARGRRRRRRSCATTSFKADREVEGTRWSYCRDIGRARLVMVDSRAGRVLDPGARSMVDEDEWRWIEEHATGDCDHLLIGTSLPLLLAPGMHYLEAWNEAVCEGAWGPAARGCGEKLRQALDLEHWAAFGESLERMMAIVRAVGTRRARRGAGLDRRAVGRRPPRLPRRGRLPARHRHALDRVAGDVLAVPQPARQQGAHGDALHGLRRRRRALMRGLAAAAGVERQRALALRPRRAVVRQPGGDARARRAPGARGAREDRGAGRTTGAPSSGSSASSSASSADTSATRVISPQRAGECAPGRFLRHVFHTGIIIG